MTSRPIPPKWEEWMTLALEEATQCLATGDVPVGAIVIDERGEIVGRGHNTREAQHDPAGHAEIAALRQAAMSAGKTRLAGYTLVSTLEPCVMCAGAIGQAGISRLIYGAADEKAGAAGGGPHDLLRDRALPYRVDEVASGVLAEQSSELLRRFFASLRVD
jgi:tRNA(adenine34) deaminase